MDKNLKNKINHANSIIKKGYEIFNGNIVISYSGGKDSTVLLHLVRSIYPNLKGVYFNTTNEYSEIIYHVRKVPNIDIILPKYNFYYTLREFGYPIGSKNIAEAINRLYISTYKHNIKTGIASFVGINRQGNVANRFPYKWLFYLDINMIKKLKELQQIYFPTNNIVREIIDKKMEYWYDVSRKKRLAFNIKDDTRIKLTTKCCSYLKKNPSKEFQKRYNCAFYIGVKKDDSRLRNSIYSKSGEINIKRKFVYPLLNFSDQDIYDYIKEFNLEIPPIYKTLGIQSTGCVVCGYGIGFVKDKFEKMRKLLPKRYKQYENIKNKDSDITFGETIQLTEYCLNN